MADGIYTAMSGSIVQDRNLEVLSHNLANIETPGYKAQRVAFEEVLLEQVDGAYHPSLHSVQVQSVGIDPTEGTLILTENPFDVALEGDGFFSVRTPNGVQYTRHGMFDINTNGELVTQQGFPVLGESGTIQLDENGGQLFIQEDGTVYQDMNEIGRFAIVKFANPSALVPTGQALYRGGGAVRDESTLTLQGYVEESNVKATEVMVDIIRTTRLFEVTHQAIKAYQQIDSRLTKMAGA